MALKSNTDKSYIKNYLWKSDRVNVSKKYDELVHSNKLLFNIVFNLYQLPKMQFTYKEIYRNILQKSSKMPSLQYTKVLRMMLFNVFQKEKKMGLASQYNGDTCIFEYGR